ncbi:hypothetical protein N7486_009791 [Penicillium sp. IBT 16267x]|nr:hypothetical protein N7486_009791 [Penicillium sp. IBT 16267x]
MVETASTSTHDHEPKMSEAEVKERYRVEREKRLRPDGIDQYEEFHPEGQLGSGISSPRGDPIWYMGEWRVLIVGAGFGGLLFAVRLIQTGFCTADQIKIVDEGIDFGGTWHWNKYPGLKCDIESYIYLPLLEETGYMPTAKYISGIEVQEHAARIAKKWGLDRQTSFGTSVTALVWDDNCSVWDAKMNTPYGPGLLLADFVYLATGLLNTPKVPDLEDMDQFKGKVMHSSRWDYNFTGGYRAKPEMTKLKNKRVGVVGTGATAVQLIPELAKWAKEVVVFQRTAASVFPRDNEVAHAESEFMGTGWQRKRAENFNAFLSNEDPLPEVNLVNDEWSKMQSYSALIGGPSNLEPGYLEKTIQMDMEHQKEIRNRVSDIIQDPRTAESLTPWYYSWCKRPCFSDEFLQIFNESNVTLVDTKGKGISEITENGIMANEIEYDLDVMVFCTGYHLGTAFDCSKIIVSGRDRQSLHDMWRNEGISTLHGVMSSEVPNLFFSGPWQASTSANYPYMLDQLATHAAQILSQVDKEARSRTSRTQGSPRFTVEPKRDDEDAWAAETLQRARGLASGALCTPSYMNMEGSIAQMYPEQAVKAARASIWGTGVKDFVDTLEKWRMGDIVSSLQVSFLDDESLNE